MPAHNPITPSQHSAILDLFDQGYSRRAIAAKLCIGIWRITGFAKRHKLPTQVERNARGLKARYVPAVSAEQIRDVLLSGVSRKDAAEKLGVFRARVDRVALRYQAEFPQLQRPRFRPTVGPIQTQVPAWASQAGLADDYRDHTRAFNEHVAARHCRALIAEQRRVEGMLRA